MRRVSAIAISLLVSTAACSKDKDENKQLRRSGDGPAVVVLGGSETPAGLAEEVEPNDPRAQTIEVGAGVHGTLDGASDVDRYSVVLTERGMLFALAKGPADADLIVELVGADGKSLAVSDRGPAKTSEGIAGMSLEPGTYQLIVSEFTKKKLRKSGGRQGVSEPYELRVDLRTGPEEGYELEDNAETAGASEILAGEEHYGYLGWKNDIDRWRMPVVGFDNVDAAAPENGTRPALHIVMSGVPGLESTLRLRSADGGLILERKSAKGQEVAIRNFVPEVAAESYLVELSSSRYNPEDSYVLAVQDAQLPRGTEEEPNDSVETATLLQGEAGTLIAASGELTLGDVDTFGIAPDSEERILEVELVAAGDARLELAVIAESGALLGSVSSAQAGAQLRLVSIPVAANMAPAIRVQPLTLTSPTGYKLTMSLVAGHAPMPAPPMVTPTETVSE